MLSERQLEKILEVFRLRMQGAVEQYLKRMGEHLRDIGTLTASDINRLIELKRVNYNMEQVKREIAKAAQASAKDVDAVFEAVAESDARFAADIFAADHVPLIKDNPALERILKAQARITKQQLANLSQTTLVSSGYKNAVDLAVQTVQSGITDYNSAIRKALKAAAAEGLRVKYPTGYTRRLDSAVRMNILDGVRAINQDILYQIGKEFDADGVEISAHALCAEDHVPYQGLQMPIKEFERLQNVVLDRPFGMWNCRHTWHYILLGISEPRYTPQELADYRRNSRERITVDGVTKSRYEWSQEQRRIETAIRYQKDIAVAAKASGDMVARRECAYMIRELDKRYAEISKAAGLIEKRERMKVSGFNKVKPADDLKRPSKRDIMALEKGMPAVRSLSNKQAREWYLEHDARIPLLIDQKASVEEQARQAFELRNLYREITRNLMKDQKAREELDKKHPNWTFEGLIAYKMENKKFSREEAIADILETATKTNAAVNAKFGVGVKK